MADISLRIPVEGGRKQDQLEYLLPVAVATAVVGNVNVASLKPLGLVVLWTVIPEIIWGRDVLVSVFGDDSENVAYEKTNSRTHRTRVHRKLEAMLKQRIVDRNAATEVEIPWKTV